MLGGDRYLDFTDIEGCTGNRPRRSERRRPTAAPCGVQPRTCAEVQLEQVCRYREILALTASIHTVALVRGRSWQEVPSLDPRPVEIRRVDVPRALRAHHRREGAH